MGGEEKRRSSRLSSVEAKLKNPDSVDHASSHKPKMTKNSSGSPASPPSAPSTVDFTLDQLKAYMNGDFRDSMNKDIDKKFDRMSERVDQNQAEIRSHKDRMDREMKLMREQINSAKKNVSTTCCQLCRCNEKQLHCLFSKEKSRPGSCAILEV